MDLEASNKRKSTDLEDGEVQAEEPSPKQLKIDEESKPPEPNLEIDVNVDKTPVSSPKPQPVQEHPCITITFNDESIGQMYKPKFLTLLNNFVDFKPEVEENCIKLFKDCELNADDWVVVAEEGVSLYASDSPKKNVERKLSKAKKELFVVDTAPAKDASINLLRYTARFTVDTDKAGSNAGEKKGLQSCFNCEGSHNLRDCKEPKDFGKINEARLKMRSQQSKNVRYHADEEQKFAHLTPGKVSDELRKALGLRKNELPHYIYQMRRIGYPPGWLEEAKYEHSNLDMFGVENTASAVKILGLDPKKIIDYPGFNVPPEKGSKDESRKFGVPAYCDDFKKEAMIKYFNDQFVKQNDILVPCDMDLDTPEKKQPEPTEDLEDNSLVELQKQKRKLLEQLNEEPPPPNYLSVRTTCFGTPIFKSNSPYSTLPNPDNFSKDVSPVINFENLPNSTGKYEQMIDVLQKVRDTLKTVQPCTNSTNESS